MSQRKRPTFIIAILSACRYIACILRLL